MEIVFCTDENYALPTRAAVRSAIANAAGDAPLTVHVVCDESVSADSERRFAALGTERAAVRIARVQNQYKRSLHRCSHISHAAYLRYDLPYLFPDLSRILYLDCDLVVLGDLRELYALDLTDCYAAAVEMPLTVSGRYVREELRHDGPYLCSGVLVLNLEKLRRDDMPRQLAEFTRYRPWLRCLDQDAMNALFEQQIRWAGQEYNVMLNHDLN
ncbi:MAG: glycosyltransferase family 8 protein, partial [Verrucomicrobiales bacterium]|nr:glycosyltransferase family 8 protein [Verrucomicrobiales bacterium]